MAGGFDRLEVLQSRKFMYSVSQGDAVQVEKLCRYGIPDLINRLIQPEGECALHIAVRNANFDMLNLLLECGASIDRRDIRGHTAMMKAVEYGYDHILDTLLAAGASVNASDNEGKSILSYALKPTQRHVKCCEKLCKQGADVNAMDNSKETVLMKAAVQGLDEVVQILLRYNADTEIRNADNVTALFIAIQHNQRGVVELLLSAGSQTDVTDNEGNTPMHISARLGYLSLLQLLCNVGGEVDSLTNTGDTLLHLAVQHRHNSVVKMLLGRGVQAEIPNYSAVTPRNIAHTLKDKLLKRLLRRHDNAIHKACEEGKIRAGKDYWKIVLLKWNREHYDDLISQFTLFDENDNNTINLENFIPTIRKLCVPLSDRQLAEVLKSCKTGYVDYVEYLSGKLFIKLPNYDNFARRKKKKGKREKKGRKGKKKKIPLHIIVDKTRVTPTPTHENIVQKIEHFTDTSRFPRDSPAKNFIEDDSSWYMAPPSTTYIRIHKAAQLGDLKTIKSAAEASCDLNQIDQFHKTPLMIACANGRLSVVKLLLALGVDVAIQDNFKWTALHHASHASQEDIVKFLLAASAEIDVQGMNGGTPLMRAVESGSVGIVKLLLERGAKINLRTKTEKTALDIAYEWGSTEVIDLLTSTIAQRNLAKKRKKSGKRLTSAKSEIIEEEQSTVTFAQNTEFSSIVTHTVNDVILSKSAIHFNSAVNSVADENFRCVSAPPDLIKETTRRRTNAWAHQPPTTSDLLNYKVDRRKRFGFEVADFQAPRSPFASVIEDKLKNYILVKNSNNVTRPASAYP